MKKILLTALAALLMLTTANGAYLDITKLTAVTATEADVTMDITADISGIGTGIQNIERSTLNIDHSVYDLSGRRITSPAKGIYIKNGRKYIVK